MTAIYQDSGVTVYAITFKGSLEYESSDVEILFDSYENACKFYNTLESPEDWEIVSMKVFTYPQENA